jgi:hypothetical protein
VKNWRCPRGRDGSFVPRPSIPTKEDRRPSTLAWIRGGSHPRVTGANEIRGAVRPWPC